MKIGVVTNLYPPFVRGGAELVAGRVVHELHVRGHDVFVLSTRPFAGRDSLFARMVEQAAERVYRYYPINFYFTLDDYKFSIFVRALWHLVDLFNPWSRFRFRSVMKVEQPDLIITDNLKGMGMPIVKEIRNMGIRHVHTLHDIQLSVPSGLMIYGEENNWLNKTILRVFYENRIKNIISSPEIVLSPSKFLADFHKQRGFFSKSKMIVLPNPAPHMQVRMQLKRDNGPLRILYAGQLVSHKGVQFLYNTLQEFDKSFHLHIAGDGPLSELVGGLANRDKRITYHGFVSTDNLEQIFEFTDVLIVPSLCYEGSPSIIYEALNAGIPVVASDIGGVGELIQHGKNGYLFKPGDKKELKKAIDLIAMNVDTFAQDAELIRKSVEPYSLSNYVDRLEELIGEKP